MSLTGKHFRCHKKADQYVLKLIFKKSVKNMSIINNIVIFYENIFHYFPLVL